MDRRTKREIRLIMSGVLDPRRGRARSTSWWYVYYALLRALGRAGEGGFILLLILLLPISIVPFFVLMKIYGLDAAVVTIILENLIAMLVLMAPELRADRRTKKLAEAHEYMLCVWCATPIDPDPPRGVCPGCGKGYDAAASRFLWRDLHHPLRPNRKTHKRRLKFAWARAIKGRDRDQEP